MNFSNTVCFSFFFKTGTRVEKRFNAFVVRSLPPPFFSARLDIEADFTDRGGSAAIRVAVTAYRRGTPDTAQILAVLVYSPSTRLLSTSIFIEGLSKASRDRSMFSGIAKGQIMVKQFGHRQALSTTGSDDK
ncbi:hypothetical protein ACFS07_35165 [Undibacterium arcticum]